MSIFGHFFMKYFILAITYFSIPLSQVIHIFPILRINTNIDHICGCIRLFHDYCYGHLNNFGNYGSSQNCHKYGRYWCFAKIMKNVDDLSKWNSKKIHPVKIYNPVVLRPLLYVFAMELLANLLIGPPSIVEKGINFQARSCMSMKASLR